jgi:predicted kinase
MSSDQARKELAGIDPRTAAPADFGEGLYSEAWTDRTYTQLLTRAEMLVERGETVVLDASWTRAAWRAAASKVAERTHSAFVPLRCEADPDVVSARVRSRAGSVSDADERIAARLRRDAEPWPSATVIRTDGTVDRSVAEALDTVRAPRRASS